MKEKSESTPALPLKTVTNRLDALVSRTARGTDYWRARDLQGILGYEDWRNFVNVIEKAKKACNVSGQEVENHFADTTKKVGIGSDAERPIADIYLTRYACYLIAMNGDESKPEIATAQSYFAVQTRKQEIAEQENAGLNRLELRNKAKDLNKQLGEAAKDAGVQKFGQFHNAGYKGLYDGRDAARIKKEKGIPEKDNLLDRMGNAELGINIFRITQAEEQIKEAGNIGENKATLIHHEVGKKTRKAVEDIGGTMPEDLPAEVHIREIEKQVTRGDLPPQKD